jgi:hypothetical protein
MENFWFLVIQAYLFNVLIICSSKVFTYNCWLVLVLNYYTFMFFFLTKHITIFSLPSVKQRNPNGQALLASTIVPHPNQGNMHEPAIDMPFGRLVCWLYNFWYVCKLLLEPRPK